MHITTSSVVISLVTIGIPFVFMTLTSLAAVNEQRKRKHHEKV